MAIQPRSSRKKPVSQKRVAVVLASLVATLTVSAGLLLLMEGGTGGSSPMAAAVDNSSTISSVIESASPLRTNAWDYIIIYESGDQVGGTTGLADGHDIGGVVPTSDTVRSQANFHFVIDGSVSKDGMDGQLKAGTAWNHQESGAPFAAWPDVRYHSIPPYNRAIGICLDGNLDQHPISEAQYPTLIQLVQDLQNRLHIPKDHILFQWEASQWDHRLPPSTPSAVQAQYAAAVRGYLE
jgi:hypothetical protein